MKLEFYDVLEYLKVRPLMFISEINTLALESFLIGYCYSHTCSDPRELCKICDFEEFNGWVKCRLSADTTGQSWRQLLIERYDDQTSYKKFFDYIDEFKNRKFHLIAELLHHKLIDEKSKLQLGIYTDDPGYWVKISGKDVNHLNGFYHDLEHFENFLGISRSDWIILDKSKLP